MHKELDKHIFYNYLHEKKETLPLSIGRLKDELFKPISSQQAFPA
jgi:hypothetical protein